MYNKLAHLTSLGAISAKEFTKMWNGSYQACQSHWFAWVISSIHCAVAFSNFLTFYFLKPVLFLFKTKSILKHNREIICNDKKDSNSLIVLEEGVNN